MNTWTSVPQCWDLSHTSVTHQGQSLTPLWTPQHGGERDDYPHSVASSPLQGLPVLKLLEIGGIAQGLEG